MLFGFSPYYIYEAFKMYSKEIMGVNSSYVFSGVKNYFKNKKVEVTGLKTGKSLEKVYDKLALRKGIDKIKEVTNMPLVITAVDVKEAREYIFTNKVPLGEDDSRYITDIPIGKAVRASSSFPAIFCPCEFNGHSFYDGGVLDNVPVEEVRKQGADKVIAINFEADDVDEESNIMDFTMRTLDIMGNKISEDGLGTSDLIITVKTDKTGLFDLEKLDNCYKYGYDTVIQNIEKIKQVLKE